MTVGKEEIDKERTIEKTPNQIPVKSRWKEKDFTFGKKKSLKETDNVRRTTSTDDPQGTP